MTSSTQQTVELQLPSHTDGKLLECRITHPRKKHPGFGAVFAHPYGPLGGTFDDPVVRLVKQELLSAGAIVATFNFRGSGNSQGRTSWSAAPETQDFETVVFFLWNYIRQLMNSGGDDAPIKIIIGGYSYGSLVASRVQYQKMTVPNISENATGYMRIVLESAIEQARTLRQQHNREATNFSTLPGKAVHAEKHTTFSFLLVSPLPGLVGRFLALRSGFGILRDQWQDENISCCSSVAIFGDSDQFSSVKKFRTWAIALQGKPGSLFKYSELVDVDHFYGSPSASAVLRDTVQGYVHHLRDNHG